MCGQQILSKNHNGEDLFFIDRPVPENPVVADIDADTEYNTTDNSSSKIKIQSTLDPEKRVTLPSGEIKVYVTTVYVQAPV